MQPRPTREDSCAAYFFGSWSSPIDSVQRPTEHYGLEAAMRSVPLPELTIVLAIGLAIFGSRKVWRLGPHHFFPR